MKKNLPYLLALTISAIVTARLTITCIQHHMPVMATASITLGMFIALKLGAEQLLHIVTAARQQATAKGARR